MKKVRRSFEHAHQLLSAALRDTEIESYLSYVVRTDDPLLIDREPPALGAARYNQLEGFDSSAQVDETRTLKRQRQTAGEGFEKKQKIWDIHRILFSKFDSTFL